MLSRRRHLFFRYGLIFSLSVLLLACSGLTIVRQESFVFGTRVEVLIAGVPEAQAHAAIAAVLQRFDQIHRTYHAWQPSELTALNAALSRGERVPVSPDMLGLIQDSQAFSARSNGLFDPALGELIRLWGFHTDTFVPRLPDPAAVRSLLAAHPRMSDIIIDGNTVRSTNPAVALDFGGIAKGWALDQAAEILHANGIQDALINIGGNVMALGKKGDQAWSIGIQHPRQAGHLATLSLYDGEAVGTSGDYQRFFEIEGRRFSHLLDPRTGEPATGTEAVTVLITPQKKAGLLSDASSKPIFLAGEQWPAMAAAMGVRHVLRVDLQGNITLSMAMRARLRWAEGVTPGRVLE